jgi:hypothetical protein
MLAASAHSLAFCFWHSVRSSAILRARAIKTGISSSRMGLMPVCASLLFQSMAGALHAFAFSRVANERPKQGRPASLRAALIV